MNYDLNEFKEKILKKETPTCSSCKNFIKPDVVFFGESLPSEFMKKFKLISSADLVIVMGTSLTVFPFASLVNFIPSSVPILLINRDNNTLKRPNNFYYMQGDLEYNVNDIMNKL